MVAQQGIPVILLTANDKEKLESLARSAGAVATVSKQIDFKNLLALIHSAVDQPGSVSISCS
jgi:DNA-binding response OmpR family regulator